MKHVDMKKVHDSEQRTDYALVLFIGCRPKIFIIGSVFCIIKLKMASQLISSVTHKHLQIVRKTALYPRC